MTAAAAEYAVPLVTGLVVWAVQQFYASKARVAQETFEAKVMALLTNPVTGYTPKLEVEKMLLHIESRSDKRLTAIDNRLSNVESSLARTEHLNATSSPRVYDVMTSMAAQVSILVKAVEKLQGNNKHT